MSTTLDLHTSFGVALHQALDGPPAETTVCSPWSVSSALAVLAPGADDAARKEITEVLSGGLVADPLETLTDDANRTMLERGGDESLLVVSNTLWVEQHLTVAPSFAPSLAAWPGAAVRQVAIASDPEGARQIINDDVAVTTRQLIRQILPAESLTPADRAVLVNALYLLAAWLRPFRPEDTTDEPFTTPSEVRDLPTMTAKRDAPYASVDGWTYMALPLWLGLSAEVFLPPREAPDGVDGHLLQALRTSASMHKVDVHLPRFKASSSWRLIPALQALGIHRIFGSGSLPGVVQGEALAVSGAYHQAVLRVDERGVEGAAATAISMRMSKGPVFPEAEVRVDRPFWFLVTNRETGVVLFLAHVTEPDR